MRKLLSILLLLLNVNVVRSQEVLFNKVVPPLGSFTGGGGGITQDKNGFIWIAAQNGLYKYDGYHFQIYTSDPSNNNSLSTNELETVYADRKGTIWILTYVNGVDRLDPVTNEFTHFQHAAADSQSLSCDTARAILEDHEGVLWIGTNNGLDRFQPKTGKFQHYKAPSSGLSCNQVRKIYEDHQGTLWIGTGSVWLGEGGETDAGGLNRFDRKTGTFTSYVHDPNNPSSLINNKVQAIYEDSRGTFWVGTAGDGLHTMNRAAGTFERHLYDPAHPEKLSRPRLVKGLSFPDHITFITEDATGKVWIGTVLNGINRYDPTTNEVTHFSYKDSALGFTDNSGWSCYNSKDGILWFSSWGGGLYRIDPYRNHIPYIEMNAFVRPIGEDSSGSLYLGTDQGLVIKNKKTGHVTTYRSSPNNSKSLSANFVTALFKDKDNTLWVGTVNGLNRYDAVSNSFTRYLPDSNDSNSISNGEIQCITALNNDTLLIGTANGFNLMNKRSGKFTYYLNDPADSNSISRNDIRSILVDKAGNLWVGTTIGGGLNLFDRSTGSFKHYLKNISISTLFQDSHNRLWVGTGEGLYYKDNASAGFTRLLVPGTTITGEAIRAIMEDNQQNLWVSAQLGIYKIPAQTAQVVLFGANYGVQGDMNFYSAYKSSDGNLYFGRGTGYYVFSPDKIRSNPHPPEIIISGLRINSQPVTPGKNSPLSRPMEETQRLVLDHDQNIFTLTIAALHFSSPENNRLLYKLEDYDPEWREGGLDKTAFYYNVPPGRYVLKVKAASSEGVWAQTAISIIVRSPWWRTWWAYGFYGLLFLAGVYTIDRIQRRRVLAKERERTKARELVQAREIEKAYNELKRTQQQLIQSEKMASLGELTAGIAHEIQNPLNFVNNFSETNRELLEEAKTEFKAGHNAEGLSLLNDIQGNEQKINHHGRRADSIVKNMLEHSRASKGEKQLTNPNDLVDEYLRLALHGMRAKDKSFACKVETHLDEYIGKINIIPQEIGRVLLNLFNNAFYAVNEQKLRLNGAFEPNVSVTTEKQNSYIILKVSDNGGGIPKSMVDKIFQPFFTTKPTGQGTGLGLSLSYDIIKAHNGELTVESTEGEGSEFTIMLPA